MAVRRMKSIHQVKQPFIQKNIFEKEIAVLAPNIETIVKYFLGRSWLDVGIFVLNLDTIISSQLLTDSAKHCALAPLILGIFKRPSTDSKGQWGNKAAQQIQFQYAVSPRRKKFSCF